MQSMTGYSSQSIILETEFNTKIKLSINIKSVNSKYFDLVFKVPYIFNQYETELLRLIKSKIYRGNIYFGIHMDDPNAFKTSIEPSIATINGYVNAANQIQQSLKLPGTISINDIIRLPNVFIPEEKGIDEKNKTLIFAAINNALNELIIEREKEGNTIKKDIEQRLQILQRNIDAISKLFEQSHEEQKEKISKKIFEISELKGELIETHKQLLYLSLDKMDIQEEITRFNSHLININKILKSPSVEKGKQLDFMAQELLRETNTIMAKTNIAKIIDLAIENKVEIEKIREQCQNIV